MGEAEVALCSDGAADDSGLTPQEGTAPSGGAAGMGEAGDALCPEGTADASGLTPRERAAFGWLMAALQPLPLPGEAGAAGGVASPLGARQAAGARGDDEVSRGTASRGRGGLGSERGPKRCAPSRCPPALPAALVNNNPRAPLP